MILNNPILLILAFIALLFIVFCIILIIRQKTLKEELLLLQQSKEDLDKSNRQLENDLAIKSNTYEMIGQQNTKLENQLLEIENAYEIARNNISKLKEDLAKANAVYMHGIEENNRDKLRVKKLSDELDVQQKEQQQLQNNLIHLETENKNLKLKNEEQLKHFETIQKENLNRFELLSKKILDQNVAQFSERHQKELGFILNPLKENIEAFKKQVQEVYEKENKMRFSLQEQVKELIEKNQSLSEEANKLTQALTSQSKVQGDWGELILEQILDHSGLTRGKHFVVQEAIRNTSGETVKNHLGQTMIPDVLVNYPEGKQVIIDAKYSLTAYVKWTQAESKEEEQEHIKAHLLSIKNHFKELEQKRYQDFLPGLDFVMMFIPNEGAYATALNEEPDLWLTAYKKRILLVSPSSLIASLKLIEHLWTREEQNKNTQAIVERGNLLYEKIIGFMSDFVAIEEALVKTREVYENAKKKLSTGAGNVVGQTEKLKQLGIPSNKEIPQNLREN